MFCRSFCLRIPQFLSRKSPNLTDLNFRWEMNFRTHLIYFINTEKKECTSFSYRHFTLIVLRAFRESCYRPWKTCEIFTFCKNDSNSYSSGSGGGGGCGGSFCPIRIRGCRFYSTDLFSGRVSSHNSEVEGNECLKGSTNALLLL